MMKRQLFSLDNRVSNNELSSINWSCQTRSPFQLGRREGHINILTFIYVKIQLQKLMIVQPYPTNTDTEGVIESVHINKVSILSGLNLEKM